jgi:hypothetical protein
VAVVDLVQSGIAFLLLCLNLLDVLRKNPSRLIKDATVLTGATKTHVCPLEHEVAVRHLPALPRSHGAPIIYTSSSAIGVSRRPWRGGQWLQQRSSSRSFDPNQISGLWFTGIAVWYRIQVSQPPRRHRIAVVLPHRPFDELPRRPNQLTHWLDNLPSE